MTLISREDAMGAVQDHFNAHGFKGYYDGQKMMDRITALPSAETEWIPCSERLPEYMVDMGDDGVIATVEGRERNIIYKHSTVPNAWFEEGEWYINDVKLEHAKVTAWMPLPMPYREESEVEE